MKHNQITTLALSLLLANTTIFSSETPTTTQLEQSLVQQKIELQALQKNGEKLSEDGITLSANIQSIDKESEKKQNAIKENEKKFKEQAEANLKTLKQRGQEWLNALKCQQDTEFKEEERKHKQAIANLEKQITKANDAYLRDTKTRNASHQKTTLEERALMNKYLREEYERSNIEYIKNLNTATTNSLTELNKTAIQSIDELATLRKAAKTLQDSTRAQRQTIITVRENIEAEAKKNDHGALQAVLNNRASQDLKWANVSWNSPAGYKKYITGKLRQLAAWTLLKLSAETN